MTLRRIFLAFVVCVPLACRQAPAPQADIGRQVDVQIDLGLQGSHVAFWRGTAPDDVLVVIARDRRSSDERAAGRPADRAMNLPPTGIVTLRGTIEPVPDAEAMSSWRLTRDETRRLAAKGVYLRLHQTVP